MHIPINPDATHSMTASTAATSGGVPEHSLNAFPMWTLPSSVCANFAIMVNAVEMASGHPDKASSNVWVAVSVNRYGLIPVPM